MQAVKANVVAVRELIEQPEDSVHVNLLGNRKLTKCAIAGQKPPSAGFSDGERKSVRNRKPSILAIDDGGSP